MSELDLEALAAPIEALRKDVKAAYTRLDAKWEAIAERLRKLPIPCTVSYKISENDNCDQSYRLDFRKHAGKKRICTGIYYFNPNTGDEEVDVTPYEEWSGEQRVELLRHVPALFEEAAKAVKEFIQKTQL
ncbi:hypothetical protein [Lacipirellula sp.]|uniref:hypothetical protein n=1 Tax=Lacipirellula sp. TaxID=2691419 RepID=UPI003D0E9BC8